MSQTYKNSFSKIKEVYAIEEKKTWFWTFDSEIMFENYYSYKLYVYF